MTEQPTTTTVSSGVESTVNPLDISSPYVYSGQIDPNDKDKGWTDQIEIELKTRVVKIRPRIILHGLSSSNYSNIAKGLNIPVLILNGITTASIFTTTAFASQTANQSWLPYISGGISVISTLLSLVNKFFDSDNLSAKHTQYAVKYTELINNIETQLALHRHDRKYAEFVLGEVNKQENNLLSTEPPIDSGKYYTLLAQSPV